MAGVGFAMRRLADRGGLLGPLGAYGFALMLAAGPYLGSSLAVVALGASTGTASARTGMALLAYATAASMLAFAPLQFAFARILGDLLYEGRVDAFPAALARVLGPFLGVLAVAGAAFLATLPLDGASRFAAFALLLALGGTWVTMVPLSAARGYGAIAAVVTAGVAGGAALALALERSWGLPGLLTGLAGGQTAAFLGLLALADREFGSPTVPLADLRGRLASRGWLVAAGAAYGAGMWVDKLLFWWHPGAPGVAIAGALRVCPIYDNGMSLAALTAVPALALFVLLAETDLATKVGTYFATLQAPASLASVERARADLAATAFANLRLLALVQGVITAAVVVFGPELVHALALPWLSIFVFRVGAVAAFLQVLFMATLVHLLYLDMAREAAWLAALLFVANVVLTTASFAGGLPAYGFGYAGACALALGAALWTLDGALADLERLVFTRQPL
ncbi:MAG: histidine kinase [Cyanobacteria bacterium RYN_339]|nr:histidine kinase [Cyanobacteria bacterium RYN_339]